MLKRCWRKLSRIKTSVVTFSKHRPIESVRAPLEPSVLSRKSATRQLKLLLALCALSMAPTCGKSRPPSPPIERIQQRTELLSGAQRGNQVILSWPAPRRNASSGSVQSIRRIDVYRVAEKLDAPAAMTEDEFAYKQVEFGVLSEIKPPITDLAPYQNRQPVEITGKPLSEVILEERR